MSVRSLVASVAVGAGLAAGIIGVGVPALAATPSASYVTCPGGNVTCEFDGRGYVNAIGYREPGVGLADISSTNRNLLSSWINYTTTGARFYYNTGGNGTCVPMGAQNRASATGSNPDDNQAESHAFTRTC